MTIVKKFDIEMAHIVRNAWSNRCAESIHGHTYTIEVALRRSDDSVELYDDGRMVVDFGLVKKYLHPFIDSFDHAILLWSKDKPEILNFFKDNFERVIVCPESSSCEMMSAYFFVAMNDLIKQVPELKDVVIEEVIVHETKTGRAHYNETSNWLNDVRNKCLVEDTWFSPAIIREWPQFMIDMGKRGEFGAPSFEFKLCEDGESCDGYTEANLLDHLLKALVASVK